MPDMTLFGFSSRELSEALDTLAPTLRRSPAVLEKDIWVCWTLARLFHLPSKPKLAFKGGTSLSKVWHVIDRFSEDVDVTIDYAHFAQAIHQELGKDFDPLAKDAPSRTKLKRFRALIEQRCVPDFVDGEVRAHLQACADREFGADVVSISVAASNASNLEVRYPSVTRDSVSYLRESVLLEFGGRNATDPTEKHLVRPDIADHVQGAPDLPQAHVDVLAVERTFWEKLTAVHAMISRAQERLGDDRVSRHWFDLYCLTQLQDMRERVLGATEVRDQVIILKSRFFRVGGVNYEDCRSGQARLVPEGSLRSSLSQDYETMRDSGMIHEDAPTFDDILEALSTVQDAINALV